LGATFEAGFAGTLTGVFAAGLTIFRGVEGLRVPLVGLAAAFKGFATAFEGLVAIVFAGCLVAPLRAVEGLTVAFSFAEDIEDGPFEGDFGTAATVADRLGLGAILGADAEARGEGLDGISLKARVFQTLWWQ